MTREPVIQRIRPDETGRVLDRRRIRKFYFLMLPVLLPFLVGGLAAYLIWGIETEQATIIGGILFGLSVLLFIAYCVYESFFISVYPARCYLRWLRERIDHRRNAIVAADDPDAFFVQIIPRENWKVSMGENASDMGLLVIDYKRDELRYEGDVERWTVPAECIRSYKLRSFTPPNGLPFLNQFTVVLLQVELDDRDIWESPLAAQPIHVEMWTPAKRRQRAEVLQDAIAHLVDPSRNPALEDEALDRLRPPARAR
ncbi:MAG: hypothetical protein J2P46_22975 [Zavarzinella sp.]|nr:hypothetical protein [Zavarzinella sp.]